MKTTSQPPAKQGRPALQGIALPPKKHQAKLPETWLKKLPSWGYHALALQNDPTLPHAGAETDPRDGIYRLHFLYDLGAEKPRNASLRYFKESSRRAKANGLKVYLDCWEPAVPVTVWKELPDAWKAKRAGKPSPMNLDFGCPEAVEWYWEIVTRAFTRLPDVDGVILGREDNGAQLLDPADPMVPTLSMAGRWAAFYRRFYETLQTVRPGLELILYDWWWGEGDHAVILDHLPAPVTMITRFENNTHSFSHPIFTQYESLINDVSLPAVQLINDAQQILDCYRKRKNSYFAMIPFLGPIETFMLPYALVPGMYFRKMDSLRREKFSGWMDYDCGGIDDGLTADILSICQKSPKAPVETWQKDLLDQRYGAGARPVLMDAFASFESAIRLLPADVFARTNRMLNAFGYVSQLCIGLPVRPSDAWQGRADWERPDGRSPIDPHNYTEARSLERILSRLPLAIMEQQTGLEQIRSVQSLPGTAAQKAARAYDAQMAGAYLRMLRSIYHFYAIAGLLQKIRRENRIIPADMQTLEHLRLAEIENTKAFASLLKKNPEFYANSTHDVWRYLDTLDKRLGYGPDALPRKCAILEEMDWEKEIRLLSPTVAVQWNVGKWRGYPFP